MCWADKAKAQLRNEIRADLRTRMPADTAEADRLIVQRVRELPVYAAAETVFLFVGRYPEIPTAELIERAVLDGKTVALPKSQPHGRMDFYRYTGTLQPGLYGILEPVSDTLLVPTEHDLMLVPGLSFTPEGVRLGQGGGYYDRYLAEHPCFTLGLCRQRDLRQQIPTQWNDLQVNAVLTESSIYCK